MFLGCNITGYHEYIPDRFGQRENILAGAMLHDLFDDLLAGFPNQASFFESQAETRAGIGQLQIPALVVNVPDIGQGEDRLTAVAFTTSHRGNGAGRSNGGLGGVTNAEFLDAFQDIIPIHQRATPVTLVRSKRLRRRPA